MPFVVTTAPATEPVSLSDAKLHLRIDHDEEDVLLERLITAARKTIERWEWRTHINTTYTLYLQAFPETIYFPRPPLSSVTSIKYYNVSDVLTTVSSSDYEVDTNSEPGRAQAVATTSWPSGIDDRLNPIEIVYVGGYGSGASDVPENTRSAILLLVEHWFWNRGAMHTIQERQSPLAVQSLLDRVQDCNVLDSV